MFWRILTRPVEVANRLQNMAEFPIVCMEVSRRPHRLLQYRCGDLSCSLAQAGFVINHREACDDPAGLTLIIKEVRFSSRIL